jgi:hypothetical protein
MNTRLKSCYCFAGISVLTVTFLAGASLLVLAAVLSWSTSNTRFTQRQNQYLGSISAAEAAVEKIIARLSRDFQTTSETDVYNNLSSYRPLVPTGDSLGNGFEFSDAQGHVGQLYVERLTSWSYTPLLTRLPSASGNAATYRIIANARELNAPYNSVGAIRQDVQIASIPIFQYQVFYAPDLEMCPGANITITGPVHCNRSIYLQPNGATLTLQAPVTASRQIVHDKSPNDPSTRALGSVTYNAGRDMRVNTLNLPIGTNNSSSVVHGIIEIPPAGEATNSLTGLQRYYNKADLIVLVSNNTVVAMSGAYNNFSVTIPWTNINLFLNTNASFFNKRSSQTVKATEINIGDFNTQYATLTTLLGRNPKVLYIADLRTQVSSTVSGVRLINGQTLPSAGLTVATINPLYIKGHYNAPSAYLGTTNTTTTAPASLVADAITTLSGSWGDPNSTGDLSARPATSTTINAAVIAGIVPSGGGYYSGGVENFCRLLEDWSGRTLTFNGSMVALYPSQIATAPWGASSDVYNPPTRKLARDWNFINPAKLPPGTPELKTLIRSQWAMIPLNTIQ